MGGVVVVGLVVVVVVVVVVVDEVTRETGIGRVLKSVVVVAGILTVCKTGLSCSHRYDPGTLTHLQSSMIKTITSYSFNRLNCFYFSAKVQL